MKNLFALVKEYNLLHQKNARELSIRAGKEVFPIYSKKEMIEYLTGKMDGAVSIETIPDMAALKLPQLDGGLAQKVMADNPERMVVADSECPVVYTHSYGTYYAKVTIEEVIARGVQSDTKVEDGNLKSDDEKLQLLTPGGRILALVSNGVEATTFQELVEKLETKRIERAWSDKRSELEYTSWIKNPADVFTKLSTVLDKVEITKTDNGEGEPIYGWVYLHSDSDPDFKVLLEKDEEKARESTRLALKRLVAKATKEERKVPQEMPWFDSDDGYRGSMTELGNALATAMESLPEQFIPETPADAEAAIELLKKRIAEIKVELAGKFEEALQKIQNVRGQIEEIQDAEYAEDELSEIRDLLSQAETLLKSGNTDEAITTQGKAKALVAAIPGLVTSRKAAETDFNDIAEKLEEGDLLYNLKSKYDDYRYANDEESELARKYNNEIWGLKSAKKFAEAKDLTEEVLAAAQVARARFVTIRDHLAAEYDYCPVSNQILGGDIWISGEDAEKVRLFNGGKYGETVVLKSSQIEGASFVEVAAKFNDQHKEYEVSLNIIFENWIDDAAIDVSTLFTPPTKEALQAALKVSELKREIVHIEGEIQSNDRIVLKFQKTIANQEVSFEIDDVWKSEPVLFVVNYNMINKVRSGEEWICSIGRNIGTTKKGRAILVVDPIALNDLDKLKKELRQAEQRLAGAMAGIATVEAEEVEGVEVKVTQESLDNLVLSLFES